MEQKEKMGHPVLTVEWLRKYKGFENISEEEAEKALLTIRSLAHILMGVYAQKGNKRLENNEQSRTTQLIWQGPEKGE